MNYTQARPLIRSGDLLAWSHRAPWYKSWYDFKIAMVRAFTQSEYSHVGVAWCVGDRVFVLEAVTPLVRIYPLSKLGEFYYIPLPAKFNDAALEYALSKVGEPYSQLQAMQAVFKTPQDDKLWQCAEYAARTLLLAGVNLGKVHTPTALVREAMLTYGSLASIVENDDES